MNSATDLLARLTSRVASGWTIEGPVFERPAYHGLHGRVSAFELLLRSEQGAEVFALPDVPEVRSYLRDCGIEALFV